MDAGLLPDLENSPHVAAAISGTKDSLATSLGRSDPVRYFRNQLISGWPWAVALLETIGLWKLPSEVYDDRTFQYLIGGEAFDWLLLAERILTEVPEAAPVEDQEALLFRGVLPPCISLSRFKTALGPDKYRAHLSYFYGITVEEALIDAVEVEVLKSRSVRGLNYYYGVDDMVMEHLYGADLRTLLKCHHRDYGRRPRIRHSLSDWKEFLYWLFKYRINRADSSKVASDTKKGIDKLEMIGALSSLYVQISESSTTMIPDVRPVGLVTAE